MFINGFDFGGREVLEFAFECLFVFVCGRVLPMLSFMLHPVSTMAV